MYTLYGHEGASTSASFSPMGDYFVTGGNDSVVLAWESNMNKVRQENISEIQAKIDTELFVTNKEKVDKLPESRGTKMGKKKGKENKNSQNQTINDDILDNVTDHTIAPEPKKIGTTYRKLKPEVKTTLEKVVY